MNEMAYMNIRELYQWCERESVFHFSAKDKNREIVLRTKGRFSLSRPDHFEATPTEDDDHIPVTLIACHCGENRNGSVISRESMEAALPSFQMKPILANIIKKEDGTWDFGAHDMKIVDSPFDGEEKRVEYEERQVGTVVGDIRIFHNDELDLDQVEAHGFIEREYGNGTYEILRDRGEVATSVELSLDEFSFDVKSKLLTIEKFRFTGVTLLGADILPGMVGSNMTLTSSDAEEDAIMTFSSVVENIADMKEGENELEIELNENVNEEVNTESEITSDVEEIVEETFEQEVVNTEENAEEVSGSTSDDVTVDEDSNSEEEVVPEEDATYRLTYELSHDDIRVKLYEALAKSQDENEWCWIQAVYDEYFVYERDGHYYRRDYSIVDNVAELGADEIEVYAQFLTAEEVATIDTMRNEYYALVQYKADNEAALDDAAKEALISDEYYDSIRETEEFRALVENKGNYSAAEFEREMNAVSEAAKKKVFYSSRKVSKPAIRLNAEKKVEASEPYGDLFKE